MKSDRKWMIGLAIALVGGLLGGYLMRGPGTLENMMESSDTKARRQAIGWLARQPHQEGMKELLKSDPLSMELSEVERNEFFSALDAAPSDATREYLKSHIDHKNPYIRFRSMNRLIPSGEVTTEQFVTKLNAFVADNSIPPLERKNVVSDLFFQVRPETSAWVPPFCKSVIEKHDRPFLTLCLSQSSLADLKPEAIKELFEKGDNETLASLLSFAYSKCPPNRLELLGHYLARAKSDPQLVTKLEGRFQRMPKEDQALIKKSVTIKERPKPKRPPKAGEDDRFHRIFCQKTEKKMQRLDPKELARRARGEGKAKRESTTR